MPGDSAPRGRIQFRQRGRRQPAQLEQPGGPDQPVEQCDRHTLAKGGPEPGRASEGGHHVEIEPGLPGGEANVAEPVLVEPRCRLPDQGLASSGIAIRGS